MSYKTGRRCKLFYDVSGVGGGTYVEAKIVKEPTSALSKDKGEVDNRESDYTRAVAGQKKAPLSITIHRKLGDPFYEALRDAWINDTVIGIAQATGPVATVGTELIEADYLVFDMPIGEPLSGAGEITVELDLAADSDTAPSWSEVTV